MGRKSKTTKHDPQASAVREAVSYVRVSSDEQEDGYSIPAQIRAAKKYAAEKGLKLVHEFEAAESAKRAGRKTFNAMCDFIKKANKPMALLVEKPDRLFRNLPDWVDIEELMHEHDLEIHYFKERKVLSKHSNSDDRFMHGIQVLMAKKYIENLAEECRKGMNEKAAQGHYPSKAPLGYSNNPVTRLIDLDPIRAPIIRRIFERYATGEYSMNDLLSLAKEEGLAKASYGRGSVSRSTIERILKNPFYYGTFEWPKGKLQEGKHEPIISLDLFHRVQEIMVGRGGGVYQDRNFAFAGLMTCAYCGCQVTAEVKKQKYVYYHCTGRKGECPKPYVREEAIGQRLGAAIKALQLDERLFQTFREALKSSLREQEQYREAQVAHLSAEETRLRNRLKQLTVMRLDGEVDAVTYQDLKASLEVELSKIQDKLAAHDKADRKTMDHGVQLLELAQTAYTSYLRRSPEEQRRLLNFVCSKFAMTDDEVIPTYRKPFDIIASAGMVNKKGQGADASDLASCPVEYPQRGSNPCYHLERVVS